MTTTYDLQESDSSLIKRVYNRETKPVRLCIDRITNYHNKNIISIKNEYENKRRDLYNQYKRKQLNETYRYEQSVFKSIQKNSKKQRIAEILSLYNLDADEDDAAEDDAAEDDAADDDAAEDDAADEDAADEDAADEDAADEDAADDDAADEDAAEDAAAEEVKIKTKRQLMKKSFFERARRSAGI